MSAMHYCLPGMDDLCNPLLLDTVNDAEDFAANGMGFAPIVWLDSLLDSGNGFGAMCFESAFPCANSEGNEFQFMS